MGTPLPSVGFAFGFFQPVQRPGTARLLPRSPGFPRCARRRAPAAKGRSRSGLSAGWSRGRPGPQPGSGQAATSRGRAAHRLGLRVPGAAGKVRHCGTRVARAVAVLRIKAPGGRRRSGFPGGGGRGVNKGIPPQKERAERAAEGSASQTRRSTSGGTCVPPGDPTASAPRTTPAGHLHGPPDFGQSRPNGDGGWAPPVLPFPGRGNRAGCARPRWTQHLNK